MNDEIQISEANEKDHFTVVLQMTMELEKHSAKSNSGYWLYDDKIYTESCKRAFNDKDTKVYVAYLPDTEQVIGMGRGIIEYHKDSPISITGCILYLWVEPEYRRNNVGKAIVKELINLFKYRGVQELSIDYSHGNIEAERFWGRMGFKPSVVRCYNRNIETKLN
jgi:GNAT superfamily N-acetyltransferase